MRSPRAHRRAGPRRRARTAGAAVALAALAASAAAGCTHGGAVYPPRDVATQDASPLADRATPDARDDVGAPRARVIGPLRPLGPGSTATVNTPRPTLRWAQPDASAIARAEVCADRACAHVEQRTEGAGQGTLARPLEPGLHYWRVTLGAERTAVWELFVRRRYAVEADTGWGVATDVNGDGRSEVVIASNHAGASQQGRVALYLGRPDGVGGVGGGADGADRVLEGVEPNGYFGWSVAAAGDVNGDGYGDLLVGAPNVGGNNGRVYVFHGTPDGPASATAATLEPLEPLGNFGNAVSAAGDVDGDGYADVLVGQAAAAGTSGRVYLYRGTSRGLETAHPVVLAPPADDNEAFGVAVAGAGDVDGDGYADVLVGASSAAGGAGAAYLFHGGADVFTRPPERTLLAAPDLPSGSQFGWFVAFAGDLDADGFDDVVVSAPGTAAGNAYVYRGGARFVPTPARTLEGVGPLGLFGWAAAAARDINGDGFDDLALGATCEPFGTDPNGGPYPHCGPGVVYVFHGAPGLVPTAPTRELASPAEPEGAFGWSIAGGDVDGDGFADVTVSAYAASAFAGAAYLYRGGTDGLAAQPWRTFLGGAGSSENLGWSVARHDGRGVPRRRVLARRGG